MDIKSLIVNKSALRRIFFIYVPVALALYLLLQIAAFMTDKASPPLDLARSFAGKLPVVYSEEYNIEFFGLEKLHHFDSTKYRKIMAALLAKNALKKDQVIAAAEPDAELLALAHGPEYLEGLNSSLTLAKILELNALKFLPAHLARNLIVRPMLYQTGGGLLAAKAALKYGWAINLGGGFHHASHDNGEGFCAIADISLIVKYLRREKLAQKVMIVDLDAHQGNAHETDFTGDADVFILDAYNREIFPGDAVAKQGIDLAVELGSFTADAEYLQKVKTALDAAFAEFRPDIVIYNAGTDILENDPLGALDISPEGVAARDEMVFGKALGAKVPVVMLLSGGYQPSNAEVIADSILNLREKFKLF